jgi:hypothetical protein
MCKFLLLAILERAHWPYCGSYIRKSILVLFTFWLYADFMFSSKFILNMTKIGICRKLLLSAILWWPYWKWYCSIAMPLLINLLTFSHIYRSQNFMGLDLVVFVKKINFKPGEKCNFTICKIALVGHFVAAILEITLWYCYFFLLFYNLLSILKDCQISWSLSG